MQKLREHYESQDTEALLELTGKDLTDEARAVLTSVLAARGVTESRMETAKAQHEAQAAAESLVASRRVRLAAFVIDFIGVQIVVAVALIPLGFLSPLYAVAYLVLWGLYFCLRDAMPELGVGKRLMKIRVVQADSGLPCTLDESALRNLLHLLPLLDAVFILGERRMRLGDHLAGTRVVRASAT